VLPMSSKNLTTKRFRVNATMCRADDTALLESKAFVPGFSALYSFACFSRVFCCLGPDAQFVQV